MPGCQVESEGNCGQGTHRPPPADAEGLPDHARIAVIIAVLSIRCLDLLLLVLVLVVLVLVLLVLLLAVQLAMTQQNIGFLV